MTAFDAAFAFTDSQEWSPGNEFSNDPNDPGGATYKGFTLALYRDYNRDQSITVAQLCASTDAERMAIYRVRFWNAVQGDHLPPAVALSVCDMGFNEGAPGSARLLQGYLGVEQDGAIGPKTLGAVAKRNPGTMVAALSARQEAYYQSLATFADFGRGWTARVLAREAAAVKLLGVTLASPPPAKPSIVVPAISVPNDDAATDALNLAQLTKASTGA